MIRTQMNTFYLEKNKHGFIYLLGFFYLIITKSLTPTQLGNIERNGNMETWVCSKEIGNITPLIIFQSLTKIKKKKTD